MKPHFGQSDAKMNELANVGVTSPASVGYLDCACSGWCRAEPQDIRDIHHKNCPKHADIDLMKITVWKVSHNGSSYISEDTEGLFCIIEEAEIGDEYTFMKDVMLEREYKALPEFTGF
jgi:hypothetical protein